MLLCIEFPEHLVDRNKQELETLAFESLVVRLYALGNISSGEGSMLLHITRREFLDLPGQYNVSIFDDSIDLRKEGY